jgi:hypothetical protein
MNWTISVGSCQSEANEWGDGGIEAPFNLIVDLANYDHWTTSEMFPICVKRRQKMIFTSLLAPNFFTHLHAPSTSPDIFSTPATSPSSWKLMEQQQQTWMEKANCEQKYLRTSLEKHNIETPSRGAMGARTIIFNFSNDEEDTYNNNYGEFSVGDVEKSSHVGKRKQMLINEHNDANKEWMEDSMNAAVMMEWEEQGQETQIEDQNSSLSYSDGEEHENENENEEEDKEDDEWEVDNQNNYHCLNSSDYHADDRRSVSEDKNEILWYTMEYPLVVECNKLSDEMLIIKKIFYHNHREALVCA